MIKTGLDIFIERSDEFKNRKVALIANQTSVTADLRYSWEAFQSKGIALKRIFSPEHGLFAVEQDQIAVHTQPSIGCEVVSLYGSHHGSLIPDLEHLTDVDVVLMDIQDIGSRYYTYVNTMALFMREINGLDLEFIVLDRPNPLNGISVEGPRLEKRYESFVGVFNVPVRHGMTAGELALLYKSVHKLDINLRIIPMKGWERPMYYKDTGLPWIPPSPNMPAEYIAYLYPGMCLLEGTNISEGRGTSVPFVNVGAPYMDAGQYSHSLNSLGLDGVYFRPICFRPTFNKYSGEIAQGVFIHITDINTFKAFATGVAIVKTAYDMYGNDFAFLKTVYEFNDTHPAFDLLAGSGAVRQMLEARDAYHAICNTWQAGEADFLESRKEYLLY
jgi:uncharacterized protein YbbC (DUF1343 family)